MNPELTPGCGRSFYPVIAGHGTAADRTRLLAFRDMLRRIEDRILALVEARLETRESCRPNQPLSSTRRRGSYSDTCAPIWCGRHHPVDHAHELVERRHVRMLIEVRSALDARQERRASCEWTSREPQKEQPNAAGHTPPERPRDARRPRPRRRRRRQPRADYAAQGHGLRRRGRRS